jgi:hypothetical protein
MIKIYLGLPGSGKTISAVREMYLNNTSRKTFTNIIPKKPLPNIEVITSDMIFIKKMLDKPTAKKKFDLTLNKEFWQNLKEPVNVIIDEAHIFLNPRRSMSQANLVMNDWMSLIRRVLGSTPAGEGELVLITQLPNRLDINAREMATNIRYHICHYRKRCKDCGANWKETSETTEPRYRCPLCRSVNIFRCDFKIEVLHFKNMDTFIIWQVRGNPKGSRTLHHRRYFLKDVEYYFDKYDTLQWDNLVSDVY